MAYAVRYVHRDGSLSDKSDKLGNMSERIITASSHDASILSSVGLLALIVAGLLALVVASRLYRNSPDSFGLNKKEMRNTSAADVGVTPETPSVMFEHDAEAYG